MVKLLAKKMHRSFFDGKATLVRGTHTHIPTNDASFSKGHSLSNDAGMCGDYDSVIGMNKENSSIHL